MRRGRALINHDNMNDAHAGAKSFVCVGEAQQEVNLRCRDESKEEEESDDPAAS